MASLVVAEFDESCMVNGTRVGGLIRPGNGLRCWLLPRKDRPDRVFPYLHVGATGSATTQAT
jgi:hypothetical protein